VSPPEPYVRAAIVLVKGKLRFAGVLSKGVLLQLWRIKQRMGSRFIFMSSQYLSFVFMLSNPHIFIYFASSFLAYDHYY